MLNPAQFAATNKANLEILLSISAKAFDGVEQLAALNLQTVKRSLDEAAETSRAALSVKDLQSLLALQAGMLQPAAEKAAAYGRRVYDIVATTKAEFEKIAAAQAAGVQNAITDAIDAATNSTPEGSSSGIALFKSAMAAANNAFNSMQEATLQATEAAEANYAAVTGSAVKAAAKAKRG